MSLKSDILGKDGLFTQMINGIDRSMFIYKKLSSILELTKDINSRNISVKVDRLLIDQDLPKFRRIKEGR